VTRRPLPGGRGRGEGCDVGSQGRLAECWCLQVFLGAHPWDKDAPGMALRSTYPSLELSVPAALGRAAVHLLSISPVGLLPTASSNQVDLRHPKLTTYRCFLPDLTGFAAFRCAGPGYQRYLSRAVPAVPRPRAGIQPRYSGLRVQGTASSPSSTAEAQCYINAVLVSRWFSTRGQPLEGPSALL